ncbi:sialic acid-binding Ig-like lectin 6 [Elephas maximus indicus]|uniref:sialic acid-binding Ig-like lectin 6 n=1 Tax=Elephas maximus indicus TaxID=99487 RepID=UPI002115D71F|nr:sialic acid-binding Ig-like lectin 6 [Elephas maximus indicus]XP_049747169.1 sialic acid-binding Ig-like lectin 6 [Elephas maximus indicus]
MAQVLLLPLLVLLLFKLWEALTQKPEIYIPKTLVSSRPGNLNCTVPWAYEKGKPLKFFWTGAAINFLASKIRSSSVLTLIPWPQDLNTNLTCYVTLPGVGVSIERTVQLDVFYAPQFVTINASLGNYRALKTLGNGTLLPVLEGQSLLLECMADGNPPAMLS